jgi:hypothetical protein
MTLYSHDIISPKRKYTNRDAIFLGTYPHTSNSSSLLSEELCAVRDGGKEKE